MGQLHRTDSVGQASAVPQPVDTGTLIGALEILSQELVRWSAGNPQLRAALHDAALFVASSTSGSGSPLTAGRTPAHDVPAQNTPGPGSPAPETPAQETAAQYASAPETPPAHTPDRSNGRQAASPNHTTTPGHSTGASGRTDPENGDRPGKPRYSDVCDDDLPLIIERCRLKAEGTRWAVERDELLRDGADFAEEIRPVDAEIIEQARALPNCFLWMNQPRNDTWTRADDYLLVADCFDTLADTLETMRVAMDAGNAEQFMEAVLLVAEAQSAVRCAVAQVETHADSDQQQTYHWLRNRASRERFYISRYMRISDPADPEECDNVSDRAQKLKQAIETAASAEPAGSQTLRVRLKLLAGVLSTQQPADREQAIEILEGICTEDYAPVLPELCQLLLPFNEELRQLDLPAEVSRLLGEIAAQHSPADSSRASDTSQSADAA